MNIFSKQMLLLGSSEFEVYRINKNGTTSLGVVKNPNLSFINTEADAGISYAYVLDGQLYSRADGNGTSYVNRVAGIKVTSYTWGLDCVGSSRGGYYISSGKLFYVDIAVNVDYSTTWNITQIGNDTTWTFVVGGATALTGFAVNSSGLYYLSSGTATLVSQINNWSKITTSRVSAGVYGYGISDGKLYYINANGSGLTQKGNDTTWTDICGFYCADDYCGYGINNGKLYLLDSTVQQIGSSTTWTDISGYGRLSSSYPNYALGIDGGKLYKMQASTITQIGSSSNWVGCSGYCAASNNTSTMLGLAYDNSDLYAIYHDGSISSLISGEFIYCNGLHIATTSGNTLAMAIRKVV